MADDRSDPPPDTVPVSEAEALVLVLDGFEGPLDMLLGLAREQKVDLTRISVLALAEQYLAFIDKVRAHRLELAADYLVMAAWLAYLKSRLLLPEPDPEEPSGEEMAAALAFQIQRLEAMKTVAGQLLGRPRLGVDVFPRGAPEDFAIESRSVFEVTLYDLLKAYGEHRRRRDGSVLRIEPVRLYSIEDAIARLSAMLGRMPDWTMLRSFLPDGETVPLMRRSALAAHFVATLELTREGRIELRQDRPFAPIWLRVRHGEGES
jgi:segregation and condensation protein A